MAAALIIEGVSLVDVVAEVMPSRPLRASGLSENSIGVDDRRIEVAEDHDKTAR